MQVCRQYYYAAQAQSAVHPSSMGLGSTNELSMQCLLVFTGATQVHKIERLMLSCCRVGVTTNST
jgi:hypothetical protein